MMRWADWAEYQVVPETQPWWKRLALWLRRAFG